MDPGPAARQTTGELAVDPLAERAKVLVERAGAERLGLAGEQPSTLVALLSLSWVAMSRLVLCLLRLIQFQLKLTRARGSQRPGEDLRLRVDSAYLEAQVMRDFPAGKLVEQARVRESERERTNWAAPNMAGCDNRWIE